MAALTRMIVVRRTTNFYNARHPHCWSYLDHLYLKRFHKLQGLKRPSILTVRRDRACRLRYTSIFDEYR
ncbi:hypothetical protein RSOLAG1IB_12028 [Rhizoctonia solani AG-1 IB]|uniref:Uncharacterized protein n=1 Tax=Thanatephorus cucumeris (strain AG1-IB / isolate 7/3/14) TaxID=1108050 RepID=A0A0B7FKS5_THACB|nr:hypothetical protein RSOLAG1IB_12028 [Rhizoctonia solani AG-1 IB]